MKDGILALYCPLVWPSEPAAPQLYALHCQVSGQEGIKKFFHDGCFTDFFDETILGFYASLPDLEEIEMKNTTLIGDSFAPFEKEDSKLHSLDLRNCFIKYEAYRSIGKVKSLKNLKNLIILAPHFTDESDEAIRHGNWLAGIDEKHSITPTVGAEIAKIIAEYKHLEHIVLDHVFLPWKEEIEKKLPETQVRFGKRNDYDGELEYVEPE